IVDHHLVEPERHAALELERNRLRELLGVAERQEESPPGDPITGQSGEDRIAGLGVLGEKALDLLGRGPVDDRRPVAGGALVVAEGRLENGGAELSLVDLQREDTLWHAVLLTQRSSGVGSSPSFAPFGLQTSWSPPVSRKSRAPPSFCQS